MGFQDTITIKERPFPARQLPTKYQRGIRRIQLATTARPRWKTELQCRYLEIKDAPVFFPYPVYLFWPLFSLCTSIVYLGFTILPYLAPSGITSGLSSSGWLLFALFTISAVTWIVLSVFWLRYNMGNRSEPTNGLYIFDDAIVVLPFRKLRHLFKQHCQYIPQNALASIMVDERVQGGDYHKRPIYIEYFAEIVYMYPSDKGYDAFLADYFPFSKGGRLLHEKLKAWLEKADPELRQVIVIETPD